MTHIIYICHAIQHAKHSSPPQSHRALYNGHWRHLLYAALDTKEMTLPHGAPQMHCVTILSSFYRAMLCIRGTSHGPVSVRPSVRPSVTSRSSTKTAKRRITQTAPHDSPGTLVFRRQSSPRNSTGVIPHGHGGAKCRWGGSKSATFHK